METLTDTATRTLVITRIFNAPQALVFDVWTKPEHLVQWFSPNDFTVPTCEQDLRVGGKYRFCMHAPDGADHWVWGEYLEIDRPRKLVFTWVRQDDKPEPWVDNVVTLTFEDLGGRTKFTLHHALFGTEAYRDEHAEGWSECIDKLGRYVEQQNEPSVKTFRIERSFDAPREQVWQAWADPKRFEKWWGPVGMPVTLIDPDIREGGRILYRLDGKMGTMWGLFRYLRIDPPNVIEYISSFSNEQGEIAKAPFAMDFPLEVFNRIIFTERDGKTTLILEGHPINATREQEAVYGQMHESMTQGFGGTLDQLEELLAQGTI